MTHSTPHHSSAEHLNAAKEGAAGWGPSGDEDRLARAAKDRLARAAKEERSQLSFGQRRLWFIDQLQPGNAAYVLGRRYRITGPLDTDALRQAFGWIIGRHAPLRARFPAADGEPRLAELDPSMIPLQLTDLSGRPDAITDALALARADRTEPFNLAEGPLTRARLLRLGPEDHLLALTFHHAIFDGLSVAVLEHDLSVAYRDAVARLVPSWPPLAVEYPDYAAWQHRWLAGPAAAYQAAYWRDQLAGVSPALELVTDRPRPALSSFRGGAVSVTIPATTAYQLRDLARAHRATLFMVTLAAYQVLLARYSRDPDITIGCPFAGRTHPGLEQLVGFFVSSLPLRANLAANPNFIELLRDTRTTALDAFDHQDLPFEQIIEEINPARDTSRNPLTQAWFQLVRSEGPKPLTLAGLECAAISDNAPMTTRFDLELHLGDTDSGQLSGDLVYATDLFDRASMERLAGHYVNLLAGIAADPGSRVASIPLTSPCEHTTITRTWNDTAAPAPPHQSIAAWFDHQAVATPDAPAVDDGTSRLSYAQLRTRANQLAHALREHGIGPERPAAVLLPRGADLITAILAVIKAGGAYLPIDSGHPRDRIAYMITASGARLAITTTSLVDHLPPGTPRLTLDTLDLAFRPATSPPDTTSPDNLCYIIYTSGSTGRPKGVSIQIRSLLNLVSWHIATYRPGPGDHVSQLANVAFDAATWEIWPALLSGACLHLPGQDIVTSADDLIRHFADAGTTITTTPAPMTQLLTERPLADATSLRVLVTGGDKFRPRPAHQPGVPGIPIVNAYGPTESTIIVTATGHLTPPWPASPSIGTPISNLAVYILEPALQPAGIGMPGEIFIGGVGVGRGYAGRPDLTAERFVPDPFAARPGARLYRTGDLARWRSDGTIEFLGRADSQVKIRGYRIEPGEIEALLEELPEVAQAVVTVVPAPAGDQLAAYIVPASGAHPERDLLRSTLARALPDYMIPAAYVTLSSLPLTSSGKLDARRLPAPERGRPGGGRPRDRKEEIIVEIWTEVLGMPGVGIHDDFFELGGHSLVATVMLSRIRDRFGVTMPLRSIFESRTVAELGVAVEAAVRAEIDQLSPAELAVQLGYRPS
jgi:amino acid adenylation domain-containing protein